MGDECTEQASPDGGDDRRAFYMYVVECSDGSWYTGYTTDVDARVAAHNAGRGARYTRTRGPVRLVAAARFATRHEAMSAEWHFKRLDRAEKEALVDAAASEPFELLLGGLIVPGGLGD